jgi:hypothetical protein
MYLTAGHCTALLHLCALCLLLVMLSHVRLKLMTLPSDQLLLLLLLTQKPDCQGVASSSHQLAWEAGSATPKRTLLLPSCTPGGIWPYMLTRFQALRALVT